ncbi:MAG: hypothetical protein R6V45_09385, partial [Oceanipulchritudo sp.]
EGLGGNGCLAESAKKNGGDLGGQRGRLTSAPDRRRTLKLVSETMEEEATQEKACREAGICARTYRRWCDQGEEDADRRPTAVRPTPANALTKEERARCALRV